LILELWKEASDKYTVRAYYTTQSLEQMRNSVELTLTSPPEQVPVFIPACSKADFSCDWSDFSKVIERASHESPF
jgi:4-phytase/acid phosphatase